MASYPWYLMIILPYTRRELPGWGRLAGWLGVLGNQCDYRWTGAPTRTIRSTWHGYRMRLDLRNWSDRHTYFLGRYFDAETQLTLKRLLNPGDVLMDVGANIGMMTLLGADLVGSEGRVLSFEPNPESAGHVRFHLELNGIDHVRLYACALGSQEAVMRLHVSEGYSGSATLADVANRQGERFSREVDVPVRRGDDVLREAGLRASVVKIDAEGFEPYVLEGLERTLEQDRPAVLMECVDRLLKPVGSSRSLLAKQMETMGYRGYDIRIERRTRLSFLPFDPASESSSEAVWLHREDNRNSLLHGG